jgi:hypothetical protein
MSDLAARQERRTRDTHAKRVKDLTSVIAGALSTRYRTPGELADIIIRAGYRRKRQRGSRDDLHLAVASCGDDDSDGGEP